MTIRGPLFKWFGSKWLAAKKYPAPFHDHIFEPYAGSAGYSLRYAHKKVILAETDEHISALWHWLITKATTFDVLTIPVGIKVGTDIRSLDLSFGQKLLLKSWQRTNNVGRCWTISPWGNKPGQWTANTRARVADDIHQIKHWELRDNAEILFEVGTIGTWFIDPPYQYNYNYNGPSVWYPDLARICYNRAQDGNQVIVCEAECQKTGKLPDWLPFTSLGSRVTSRRKVNQNHHSKELWWYGAGRPADYEPCGECGYDHAYEPKEAAEFHRVC